MANKKFDVAILISAYDKASRVINGITSNAIKQLNSVKKSADQMGRDSISFGKDATGLGIASAAVLAGPIMAFGDLEEAALSLKSVMMKDGGVLDTRQFQAVSNLATELGTKLPGNTKDFYEMFDTMIRNGIPAKNILDGTGKSAAYLAVALKLPYAEAGKMASKLKEVTGIADKDMMSFMDTIARTANVGVESSEMQFAFARSAGALKLMNLQGLEASKSLSSVYAMLIKTGASGETVGTGMTAVFNAFMDGKKMAKLRAQTDALGITMDFVDKKTGQFKGVENMVAQFDQLKGLNPQQRANVVQAFLGPGADANFMNILIDKGVSGYNDMIDRMKNQADLNAKVESQLAGQKAMWEAATGTFTNILAMVGDIIGDDLKDIFHTLNDQVLPAVSKWIDENKTLVKWLASGIAVFAGVALSLGAIGFAVGGVMKGVSVMITVFQHLGKVMTFLAANPWIIAIAAIALAAYLIYDNWGTIVEFFSNIFKKIKFFFTDNGTMLGRYVNTIISIWKAVFNIYVTVWRAIIWTVVTAIKGIWNILLRFTPLGTIIKNWGIIVPFFKKVWDNVKKIFLDIIGFVYNVHKDFFKAGLNIVTSIANGIMSGVKKVADAMSTVTKSAREYLPFSPAKKGAFMDLHKVKIVETIAGAMRPTPLAKAMANTTKSAGGSAGLKAGGSVGGTTITYSPNITISGGNADNIKQMLKENADYLFKLMNERNASKLRTSF